MSVQRQKHSSGSTKRRRSHKRLTPMNLHACKHCKKPKRPHHLCAHCQKY